MKKLITCLVASLLVVGAQSLSAQTADSTTSTNQAPAPKHREMSAEGRKEREAVMKIIGLTKEDLKDLTPPERRAKIKEGVQKAMTDLKAKKEAGTLTAQDQIDMEHLKKFLAAGGHHKPAATPPTSNN